MSDSTSRATAKRAAPNQDDARFSVPRTSVHKVEADGVQVFYREAGAPDAPVVLLLHGFPTSSFMFRELIPRLAGDYRVIAPDLPGFGFTEVPAERKYLYSFDGLAGQDRMFAPDTQRCMAERMGARIRTHDVDHSPMYPAPDVTVGV